ncbi:aspartate aminotransferase family protein [Sphingopyxis sp.]|jgi:beta-alanine--pyruvate transaminase|uniref:aspartate aminotransferase family protein n=1 Tax=Sphingopyxis sp. TaxID=1908224 RepID=UPI0025F03288|nr:aspartate aminotransferase family protein [Sphingopyxis sp.]
MTQASPTQRSHSAFWMPFTHNRHFRSEPRILASALGMHYKTESGREILDGTAGLWCVNAGHGRHEIVNAIQRQAAILGFGPTFQLGHPLAFAFADRLVEMMPTGLDRIFFTNSGSEAVDSALKIALAYQRAIGQGTRTRLIGRERGYHGTGFGGLSVGGIATVRRDFSPHIPGTDHLRHTLAGEPLFAVGQPADGAELADDLERLVALHGAETIAAVIVEPVAGSTGVIVPPVGYLERLREIATRHGILLIFDEVITAFGRLGAATAAHHFGVTPDLITMAKGLTNAAVPMGAVAVRTDIQEAILNAAGFGIELHHGYTYSGHPLAAAAGLATLDVYQKDGLFERAAGISPYFSAKVHSLRGARHVRDIRNLGLVAGIELDPREGEPARRALEIFHRCFDSGLLIRVTGDIIALSPPLIAEEGHINAMIDTIRAALEAVD